MHIRHGDKFLAPKRRRARRYCAIESYILRNVFRFRRQMLPGYSKMSPTQKVQCYYRPLIHTQKNAYHRSPLAPKNVSIETAASILLDLFMAERLLAPKVASRNSNARKLATHVHSTKPVL